jgi:formylglycine-generating enzyme required for sulfatase activity
MAGNVYEWCEDGFESEAYKRYKRKDLTLPKESNKRVSRGGSWGRDESEIFRCASRRVNKPDDRNLFLGFRCAMTP